jgi:hypothetical protein
MKKKLTVFIAAISLLMSLDFAASATPATPTQMDKPAIIRLPQTLDFTIDPFELEGSGQVYSDWREVENRGESDVTLTITGIEAVCADDCFTVPNIADLTPFSGDVKAVCLLLEFDDESINPMAITGQHDEIAIPLRKNSRIGIRVSGSVTPSGDWKDGDIRIAMGYRIDAVDIPEQTQIEEKPQAKEKEIVKDVYILDVLPETQTPTQLRENIPIITF